MNVCFRVLLPLLLTAPLGCESRGYVPDCPPMPLTDAGPADPALLEWRAEAVAKGCATAAGSDRPGQGGAGGASGAGN